jgi:hypothetical protein
VGNTLTNLQPTLYSVAQEVSAEPFGIIAGINSNFDDKGVAIGDKITVPVAPVRAGDTYSPTMNLNNGVAGADAIAGKVDIEITANRYTSFHLTGEQEKSLQNGGNDQEWFRQIIAQSMRTLRNEADAAAYLAVKKGASKAIGTAGATPFSTGVDELSDINNLLYSQGAPMVDAQFVMSSAARANFMKTGVYQLAYANGSDVDRKAGILSREFGFSLRASAGIKKHTQGNAANYLVDDTTLAVGATTIDPKTGTGAAAAGSVFTVGTGLEKYILTTGITANTDPVYINRPGLANAAADGDAIGFVGDYTPCLAFERSAVVGVFRPPYIPENANIEQVLVSDQFGMTYLLCRVIGDGVVTWRLHIAYGIQVVQPEHVALLLG